MQNELGNLAGIDYSMSCPAIAIFDQTTKKHYYHFYYGVKKHVGNKGHNILGVHIPEYITQEERFDNVSKWALQVLKHHKVVHVGIESISYGSPGHIVELGENIGVLKNKLWNSGIVISHYSPQTIKKIARSILPVNEQRDITKKLIKMDKDVMVKHFFKETGIALWDVFNLKPDKNPLHDIADAYFILMALKQTL